MKHFFTLACFLLFAVRATLAQDVTITGYVRDADSKEPLNGATVKLDKSKGAISDASGKFVLHTTAGEHELHTSFIGYKSDKQTITFTADKNATLEVLLKSSALQINEVVTVSQFNKNSAKETVTIEVIKADQIKNTNANNLGDVVAKIPGVLVQDGQISIRGGSSYSYGVGSRTAVLSDGLPLMSADLGESQSNMAGLSNIKQVEVVKGASSVMYGSGALNGVINIISAWPSQAEPKTSIETNFAVMDRPKARYKQWWDAPPFGTNINVNHQRTFKNVQFVIAGNITGEKSYLQFNDAYRMQTLFRLRYLSPKIPGLNFGLSGSLQYERSERFFISVDLDSNSLKRKQGSDDRYIRSNLDPFVNYQNVKGHKVSVQMRYLNIFRKGNGSDPNAVSHQIMMMDYYQYKWKNMLIVTAGLPWNLGYSSSNLYSNLDRTFSVAGFVQGEFDYKFLTLQAGVRYEVEGVDTTIEKGLPIFRAGINLQAAKATFFRASWGQGYRLPTIGEKYIAQNFTTGVYIVPNDTLKAERAWSLELGFKQGFKIGKFAAYFDAAFFWQEYKNYIEYIPGVWNNKYANGQQIFPDSAEELLHIPGKIYGLKPLNDENARIAGYELSLQGEGKIGPVGIRVLAGYTYDWPTKLEADSNYNVGQFIKDMFKYNFERVGPSDTSKLLSYRVRHLVRADLELTYWKCYIGATIAYGTVPEVSSALYNRAAFILFHNTNAVSDYLQQHIHGDLIVDMRAGININEHVKLGFIVKNLTNIEYSLRPGKVEPLRNFTLQFAYNF